MNDNFKVYLQAIIDDSSLSALEKKLAKERLEINADIKLDKFAKNKADIEKQFQALSGIIKDILGDAVTDKQATQWAKAYYKEIEHGVNDLSKAQQKNLNSIDYEIKKREEQAKVFSNSMKAQMEAEQKLADASSKIQLSIGDGTYSTQIDKIQSQFQRYGLSVSEAENKVKELRSTLSTMEVASGEKLVSEFGKWQTQVKGVKVQLDQAKLSYDKFAQPVSDEKVS